MTSTYSVEVAYAEPARQEVIHLNVVPGTTLLEAVLQSGIQDYFPDLNVETASKGIFGERKENGDEVKDQDRIEIYRELVMDPKEARRRRASR